MNKNQLDQALDFLNNPSGELQTILYALFKETGEVKKLDIKADDIPEIQGMFIGAVNSTILNKDYNVLPLSTADERGNCFYEYDLELPEELAHLEDIIGNDDLETFSFQEDELTQIAAIIVVIADDEQETSIYKKLSPVEVVGRGGYMLWKSNERFERFEDKLLRISPRFQVLRVAGQVIIADLSSIERSFGFHDVITREATASLDAISDMNIVSNMDSLHELVDDVSFARKLTRVARNSPVMQLNIPNPTIIAFAKAHPATKNKMRFNAGDTHFELDTRVAKDLFIKILNDDLLTSELTQKHYDSLAKDGVDVEEEPQANPAVDD